MPCNKRCLWVHGVSGGELPAACHFIELFERDHPDWDVVISTTTEVGWSKAEELFPDKLRFFYPIDFSFAIRRSLKRIRPDAVVLLELELWPNFVHMMRRSGVKLFILNNTHYLISLMLMGLILAW